MPEKQLELSKRSAFFSDPFFADLHPSMGEGLERRLAEFSARSMGLAGAGLGEAAHNIQVSATNDKFQVQLELPGFAPEDFGLKTKDDIIVVEAVHESKNEDGSSNSRKFTKEFKMPAGVVTEQLASTYSGAGILTVSAPRVISAPDGAEVSEAMKAQSQAFVTDDGTAVKKDDKASSQSIAATTQSEDGSTTSSFKSTSSSSSSSTMMSSGGPMAGKLGSSGGMMPSMGSGGGMDDMMSKMMSNMGSMDMGSGSSMKIGSSSSKMSSSSVSSFSSSSSSSSSSSMLSGGMSSMLGGGGLSSMPPMRGMEMPGFPSMPGMTIEEMPGPAAGTGPETGGYTVTSPLSPAPPSTHTVGAGADYKAPAATQPDSSVLLQFREGSDYKLALNMQQYSPEDIAIKLNGRQLTIEAAGHGEQFKQKHTIPDNIDLDAMTPSFSSDGVLVIKAPKKK
jgi:histone arginine demethylase JMJD6